MPLYPCRHVLHYYHPPAIRVCFQNSHLASVPTRTLPDPIYPDVTLVPVAASLVKLSTLYSPLSANAGHTPSCWMIDGDCKLFGDARLGPLRMKEVTEPM